MGVGTDLSAGVVSGMSASLAGQPLDTVRVRLQSRGHIYTSTLDTVLKTARADGLRGFFRGALPPLVGMGPKNAIGFGAHGAVLRVLEGGCDRTGAELKRNAAMHNVVLSGCAAGLAQCAVVVPSDRIKCQLQVQTGGGTLTPGALKECLRTVIREDGLAAGIFRGWWPTVWRQTLSAPVYYGSYEVLKRAANGSSSGGSSSPFATMMCGGTAGVCAYASTYPFDVIKSYVHAAPPGTAPAEVSMLAVARRMRQEHGPRWYLRAMAPTLGRAFVINAVNFAVFEEVAAAIERNRPS
jgi:hypothetical protein